MSPFLGLVAGIAAYAVLFGVDHLQWRTAVPEDLDRDINKLTALYELEIRDHANGLLIDWRPVWSEDKKEWEVSKQDTDKRTRIGSEEIPGVIAFLEAIAARQSRYHPYAVNLVPVLY